MSSKDIHGITMALIITLFRTHARHGLTVMGDVYCEFPAENEPTIRAPDVVIVSDLSNPRDENYVGTPVIAVEVRGTQSKKYLEEKVRLYLDHEWPTIWIAHAERQAVEVFDQQGASVLYPKGTHVPLIPQLDKHGLTKVPVEALFSDEVALRYNDGWVQKLGEKRGELHKATQSILQILKARGWVASDDLQASILRCTDMMLLDQWLTLAVTSASLEQFAAAVQAHKA